MKLLETTAATIEFEIVENARRDTDPRLVNAVRQNDTLRRALHEARNEIMALRAEVDKLSAPPSTYGVYLSAHDDDTVDILAQGRKVRVGLNPTIKVESLRPGQELLLNEALNVVATAGYEIQGDVVVLEARLDDDRAVVTLRADDQKIGIIADPLRAAQLKPGDHILMDPKSGYLLERLPKSEAEELGLEEVPDIGYRDVGGLSLQIEAIQDAIATADTRRHGGVDAAVDAMIASALDAMFERGETTQFLEVSYANGEKEVLHFGDFVSGAMIESVVRRAKKLALKRCIGGGEKGLVTDDLVAAVREEFKENEDLPNTSNPDDWAKIAGRKGERIVAVKSLVGLTRQPQRNMEKVVTTGQYL
jgi:SpoVK/Ycf46/Vps4 family AAA+-type ATPase